MAYSSKSSWVCIIFLRASNLLVANNFTGLQQDQPQLYDNLTKILNPEEQQVLQAVFHEADAKALAAANAEAAATGNQTNGN
jgi:hypothetical protein